MSARSMVALGTAALCLLAAAGVGRLLELFLGRVEARAVADRDGKPW